MAYSLQLPAPGSLINMAGQLDNVAGLPAPGFAGIDLESHMDVNVLRSRSNRGLPVTEGGHYWSFGIKYNPMTRNTFDALEAFVLGMNTRVNPFYVVLPNYSASKNPLFNTWDATNNAIISGTAYAGDTTLTLGGTISNANIPYPGDYFNIVDSMDALHKNVYKVTRVETNASYTGAQPAANAPRIHIFPPLQRDKIGTCSLVFQNPSFRVIQKGNWKTSIDRDGLYEVDIDVEELMP